MKIIYIDYLSPRGHVNYNSIQISALLKLKCELSLVCSNHMLSNLKIQHSDIKSVLEIPKMLCFGRKSPLFARLSLFLILLYIFYKIDFSKYDAIIFSSFESITLSLFKIPKNSYVILHNNINDLKNRFKKNRLHKILKQATALFFNSKMAQSFSSVTIKKRIIPHGLPKPYKANYSTIFQKKYKPGSFIFLPSSNSIDLQFLSQLIENKKFLNFLKIYNIKMVVNSQLKSLNSTREIIFLDYYISNDDYQYLLINSFCNLLLYDYSLKDRTSAVLLENISNNHLCLVYTKKEDNPYDAFFDYNYNFTTEKELLLRLKSLLNSNIAKYTNLDKLYPLNSWKDLLFGESKKINK